MEQEEGGKRAEPSSPSNMSSQGDMADNEMEAGPGEPSEMIINEPPPPKKKRTRTLTTPHQSAVLHALLAQSRFPTTAMREEVGRSIGLSARKVQIWFQNQRQKARRPRGQSTTTVTRPPQYGPFPNALTASRHSTAAEAGPSTQRIPAFLRDPSMLGLPAESYGGLRTSALSPVEGTSSHQEAHAPKGYATSAATSSQLAGPGIPGSSGDRTPSLFRGEEPQVLNTSMAVESRISRHFSPVRPYSYSPFTTRALIEPYISPGRSVRGSQSSSGAGRSPQSPLPITLPPILTDLQLDQPNVPASSSLTAHSIIPTIPESQPQSLHTPDPLSHRNLRIPPPFTLEPRPLWDDAAFSPFFRRPSTAAPPYTGGLQEIPQSSGSPPLFSMEGAGRDTGHIMALLRNPASMPRAASGSSSSLPPPQALLGSLWPSLRGSRPAPTEPSRRSRPTSALSDDPENDPNVNRSR